MGGKQQPSHGAVQKNNWTRRKNNSGSNPHQFSACIHALQWWIGISATGAHLRTEDDNARQRLRPSLVQRQAGGGMWRCQLCSTASQCRLCCCKNTAHSVSWPEVVKVVSNHGVDCFVSYGSFFCFSNCISSVCSVVFDCFWLSVPVQLTAWKDSSPKWPIMCRVGR